MKPNKEYIILESTAPLRGLATALDPTRLDPAYSPNMLNCRVRDGDLGSRAGYTQMGSVALVGTILGIAQFGALGAIASTVILTSKRQYYYDPAADAFVDITAGPEFTSTLDTMNDTTDVVTLPTTEGDLTDSLKSGDIITIRDSTDNDGEYVVSSSVFSGANKTEITLPAGSLTSTLTTGTFYWTSRADIPDVSYHVANKEIVIKGNYDTVAAGDIIVVSGTTNNDGEYTVVSAVYSSPNTTFTVAEAPASTTADGTIRIIDTLATATKGTIEFAEMTDINGRLILMTNGVDRPRSWSGTLTHKFRIWRPDYPDFETCRTVAVFTEHLFLGAVTLTSTGEDPQSITWSNAGNFADFVGGTSGVQLLHELETAIKTMRTLGDRLVIYADDQIVNAAFIGLPAVFAFETIIPEGTRLISPKAVVPINVGHVYMSEENIYIFDGTRGMRVIGDVIRNDYKDVKDQKNLYKTSTLNDYAKRTIMLAVPDIDGGTMVYTVEYDVFNLNRMIWGKEKYVDDVRAMGFLTNTILVTWDNTANEINNPPNNWEDEGGTWTGEGEQIEFPVRVFGNEAGEVFMINESSLTDNGEDFTAFYETIDFVVPEALQSVFGRWGEIEFEAKGSVADVLVSDDAGASFTMVSTSEVLDGNFGTVRIPIDISARKLRVRFQSTKQFGVRWVRLWVRAGGPR